MSKHPPRLAYARPNQCGWCSSRACYHRAVSECGTYDEISCRRHHGAMCDHAETVAPGVVKLYTTSTAKQRRGSPSAAQAFRAFRLKVDELDALRDQRAGGGGR